MKLPTFLLQFCTYIHTLEAMVMPRSRSRAMESIARSRGTLAPHCRSIRSSSVVLPWSTCAMMATFRMDDGDTTLLSTAEGLSTTSGGSGAAIENLLRPIAAGKDNLAQEPQGSSAPSISQEQEHEESWLEEETLVPHTPAIALPRQPELELLLCLQGFGLGLGFGSGSGLGFKALNPNALPRPLWKTRDEARTGVGFCFSTFWSISSLAVVWYIVQLFARILFFWRGSGRKGGGGVVVDEDGGLYELEWEGISCQYCSRARCAFADHLRCCIRGCYCMFCSGTCCHSFEQRKRGSVPCATVRLLLLTCKSELGRSVALLVDSLFSV